YRRDDQRAEPGVATGRLRCGCAAILSRRAESRAADKLNPRLRHGLSACAPERDKAVAICVRPLTRAGDLRWKRISTGETYLSDRGAGDRCCWLSAPAGQSCANGPVAATIHRTRFGPDSQRYARRAQQNWNPPGMKWKVRACPKNGSRRGKEADFLASARNRPPRYLGGYVVWEFFRHALRMLS